jgi:hypothetical protein
MRISVAPTGDKVNFKPVEVNSIEDLVKHATTSNYSMGVFRDNYRNKKNFKETEAIAIDVDNDGPNDNYTITEAAEKFAQYKHLIMPSRSHQKEKNGKVADRFRVILFLDRTVTDPKDFQATWKTIYEGYPAADRACKDASRFFFPSPEVYSLNADGKLWPAAKYVVPETNELDEALSKGERGTLSKQTLEFFMNGAPEGRRNQYLFKAAKDMQEQGYHASEVIAKLEAMIKSGGDWATDYVNDKDLECINNAFKEEPMYAQREGEIIRPSIFKFQRLNEMIEEAGEIHWLADNLLTEGGFSLMVGPPKAGKSTIVRQLVKSVCHGDHFLGRDVTQGRVLYLTFEEQPAVLKEQFGAIGMTGNENLMIHVGNVFAEAHLVYEDIEAAIQEYEPALVILDTLFDIVQLESINDYKEVKHALAKMRTIARDTGAHILGVHHTNKGGEGNLSIMGSNAIHGALDTLIRFVQEGERRYLFSNGKHGQHFIDQEIIFDHKTQTYALGKRRDRGEDSL